MTLPAIDNGKELEDILDQNDVDLVTFTSSSTVKNFFEIYEALGQIEDRRPKAEGAIKYAAKYVHQPSKDLGSDAQHPSEAGGCLTPKHKFKIASIGPITSKAVQEHGFEVDIQAKEYTIPGLVDAILDYYKKQG